MGRCSRLQGFAFDPLLFRYFFNLTLRAIQLAPVQKNGPHQRPISFSNCAPQAILVLRAISMVSSKSRLKKASSDGVSILDTKEISGFTFREAREVVAEFLEPPSFDF